MAFNWTCPYCNMPQTAININSHTSSHSLIIGRNAEGPLSLAYAAIACVNEECRRTKINVFVGPTNKDQAGNIRDFNFNQEMNFSQRIMPQGNSKPQPSFIPTAILEDYREACLIRDLSPKASATLIRRCLQGMIRDFTGINARSLFHEIDALRKAVDDGSADRSISIESVDSIDAVRSVGNIGAHMEKDINHIVEVEADEAQLLIELVESLFIDWYSARQQRLDRSDNIKKLAAEKKQAKLTNVDGTQVNALLPPEITIEPKE